jgi:hypothetical protein
VAGAGVDELAVGLVAHAAAGPVVAMSQARPNLKPPQGVCHVPKHSLRLYVCVLCVCLSVPNLVRLSL